MDELRTPTSGWSRCADHRAQPDCRTLVFANAGTVVDGRVLGAKFRAEQRVAEAEHYRTVRGARLLKYVMPTYINEARRLCLYRSGDVGWHGFPYRSRAS